VSRAEWFWLTAVFVLFAAGIVFSDFAVTALPEVTAACASAWYHRASRRDQFVIVTP
jgi:hypothetical protein